MRTRETLAPRLLRGRLVVRPVLRLASYMTSKFYRDEVRRAREEALEQHKVLQGKWPRAFPLKGHEVRPLASGTVKTIAETLGWSTPYTRAILARWKARASYCRAVLGHTKRIALDDSETDEEVDDQARVLAQEMLERRKAQRAVEAERKMMKGKEKAEASA